MGREVTKVGICISQLPEARALETPAMIYTDWCFYVMYPPKTQTGDQHLHRLLESTGALL
jgi:hypothetical protein